MRLAKPAACLATALLTVSLALAQQPDSPAGFVALLNADRQRSGLPPLAWDQRMADAAARNPGGHRYNPGFWQCWAGTNSYLGAYRMWMASPAHRAILFGRTTRCGVGLSAGGVTFNSG